MVTHPHIEGAKVLIANLSKRCVTSMNNKELSNISMLPYKVMTFVNSMNWRMMECAKAAILLLEHNLTHPSLMLIRSSMENAAITIALADIVRNVVSAENVTESVNIELMRLLFGNNYRKEDPFRTPHDECLKVERIGKHVKRADELYPEFQRYYIIVIYVNSFILILMVSVKVIQNCR